MRRAFSFSILYSSFAQYNTWKGINIKYEPVSSEQNKMGRCQVRMQIFLYFPFVFLLRQLSGEFESQNDTSIDDAEMVTSSVHIAYGRMQ